MWAERALHRELRALREDLAFQHYSVEEVLEVMAAVEKQAPVCDTVNISARAKTRAPFVQSADRASVHIALFVDCVVARLCWCRWFQDAEPALPAKGASLEVQWLARVLVALMAAHPRLVLSVFQATDASRCVFWRERALSEGVDLRTWQDRRSA